MLGELSLSCCLAGRGGRDVRPAAHLLFFASPKKSRQKKGDPKSATPPLCSGADLRRRAGGVRGGTRCAPAALRSNIPRESDHEAAASYGAAATPPARRRRRSHRGESETGHRCARPRFSLPLPLGEGWGEGIWGRAQRWPERVCYPLWPCRGAQGVGRAWAAQHAQASCTDLLRLFERSAQRAVSSAAPPHERAPQVARSEAKGHGQWGRLFFGSFLLAKQKKGTAPPGAHPGLCDMHFNAVNTSLNTQKPGLPRAHP